MLYRELLKSLRNDLTGVTRVVNYEIRKSGGDHKGKREGFSLTKTLDSLHLTSHVKPRVTKHRTGRHMRRYIWRLPFLVVDHFCTVFIIYMKAVMTQVCWLSNQSWHLQKCLSEVCCLLRCVQISIPIFAEMTIMSSKNISAHIPTTSVFKMLLCTTMSGWFDCFTFSKCCDLVIRNNVTQRRHKWTKSTSFPSLTRMTMFSSLVSLLHLLLGCVLCCF
jgi:hypothetical protein